MSYRRFAVCSVIGLIIAIGVSLVVRSRPWESPTARAHRLCIRCRLSADEIDALIDTCEHSVLDRDGLTAMWEQTYADPDTLEQARELCAECVGAILDAAEQ